MSEPKLPKQGSRYLFNGNEYEVVSIDNGFVTLRGIKTKTNRYLGIATFLENVAVGIIKLSMSAPIELSDVPRVLELNEKQRKSYERKVAYVIRLDNEINHAVSKNVVLDIIQEVAKKIGDPTPPSYPTVCIWLRTYHQNGGNPLKLIDRRKGQGRRKRIQREVINVMHDYLKTEYLKDTRPSAQLIYSLVSSQIAVDNQARPADRQLGIPSRATFYRMVAALDPLHADTKRLGKVAANKRHKYGKKIHNTTRLCERVEADSHLLDVLIVTEDLKEIIGRPWVCAMIDVDSRCIIGWEISFMPPCGAKVLRALRFAMSADSDRDSCGTPEELVLDNGPEFRNEALQLTAGTYGIQLRYVEPRSPDEKPHIERFFGTLNTMFVHLLPGTTRSSPIARGNYPSEKNATYTLSEFRTTFAHWVDHIYHETKHSELGIPPIDAWRQKSRYYPPNRYPMSDLDLVCRPFVYRSISGGRISIHNLQWTSPSLSMIAPRGRQTGNAGKVKVYYDETDLSYVFVENPADRTNLIRADAVDPDYQNGLSMYEHSLINRKRNLDYQVPDSIALSRVRLDFYRELSTAASKASTRKILARLQKSIPKFEDDEVLGQPLALSEVATQSVERKNEDDDDSGYEGYILNEH